MNAAQSTRTITFDRAQLDARFEELFHYAHVTCRLTTPLLGSQPADEKGIRGFVESYLKLEGQEAEDAIQRIEEQELHKRRTGEDADVTDTTPAGAELETKHTYGVKCHRRSAFGPWIGSWQIKACAKNAATSRDLFVQKRGSKNQMTEMGNVKPFALDETYMELTHTNYDPRSIHIFSSEEFNQPAPTAFTRLKGSVSNAGAKMAIMVDSEVIEPGAWFRFVFGWGERATKLTPDDVTDMLLAMQNIGLGSGRSFDSGRFRIEDLRLEVRESSKRGKGKAGAGEEGESE